MKIFVLTLAATTMMAQTFGKLMPKIVTDKPLDLDVTNFHNTLDLYES